MSSGSVLQVLEAAGPWGYRRCGRAANLSDGTVTEHGARVRVKRSPGRSPQGMYFADEGSKSQSGETCISSQRWSILYYSREAEEGMSIDTASEG